MIDGRTIRRFDGREHRVTITDRSVTPNVQLELTGITLSARNFQSDGKKPMGTGTKILLGCVALSAGGAVCVGGSALALLLVREGADVTLFDENRRLVRLKNMAPVAREAVLAIEDDSFYQHGALNFPSLVRAAVANLVAGEIEQGGSTITQQLVRNLYDISQERTIGRKVQEACLAVKVDSSWTKERILASYLNTVYYGNRAYGIEAAAQTYFSKHARELTMNESALLAGLTQAPSIYNPFTTPQRALLRRADVLRAMLDTGVITQKRFRRAVEAPLGLRPGRLYSEIREPYFFGFVRDKLIETYGAGTVRSGGLRVYTTIVPRYQRLAERAIRDTLYQASDPAAALMVCPVSVPVVQLGAVTVGGFAITSPVGKVSLKETPVKALALGLEIVKVKVL